MTHRTPPADRDWIRPDGDGIILMLHIQPGARSTAVVGLHGGALKIRLAAPPVDGKANAELLAFLARKVGAGRTAVSLLHGETQRAKRVRIDHISVDEAAPRLLADAP